MLSTLKQSPTPAMLWQGNNGFILWDGRQMIATDLDLTLSERLAPPTVDVEELAQNLDWLMITHGHGDHLNEGTVRQLLTHSRCRFVIPQSCREQVSRMDGLEKRTTLCRPGDELELNGVKVRCFRAVHGHIGGSVYSGASMLDCGYYFAFGGLRFYQPGDTLLLEEHFDMPEVDVLFVSPTEHNMGVENAVRFIRMIHPQKVIFQHHSTYREQDDNRFWTHGYVEEVMAALTAEERERCIVPAQDRIIVF